VSPIKTIELSLILGHTLRLKIGSGNRKWFQRTPAMAEKITDYIWGLKELLTFRVPVQ
jgi:hypothetical protein